ncbi:MAG: hypothetical protein H0U00_00735 [Actinobacteria bacterium]|nr:hypothetical protein [Actinomycetota bacterium]
MRRTHPSASGTRRRHRVPELRRIPKADRTRPIDGVVAVALAYWRASLGGGESMYQEHGLFVV